MSSNEFYMKSCRHGFFILVQNDYISSCMNAYGEWAERELFLLMEMLKPGDKVIEVGSNIGTHSIPIARQIGRAGSLYCFEPQRIPFQLLNGNAALNNMANCHAFRWVVSDHAGSVRLGHPQVDHEMHLGGYHVPQNIVNTGGEWTSVNTLDMIVEEVIQTGINLIKVDVEGMEERVLRGAEKSLREYKPIIFVENNYWSPPTVWDQGDAFFKWIQSLGYDCFWYCTQGFNPANFFRDPVNKMGDFGDINIVCLPTGSAGSSELQPFLSCRQIVDGDVSWFRGERIRVEI